MERDRAALARDLVACCRELHAAGLIAGCDGNVSARVPAGSVVLVTPGGVRKDALTPDALCEVRPTGEVLRGRPSSELPMHLAIYAACPEARAVVHAHPPYAVAWTLGPDPPSTLPVEALAEGALAVGRVPIVRYAPPGSDELAAAVRAELPAARVLLLARHGAVAWGEDLDEARNGIERLEHMARVLHLTRLRARSRRSRPTPWRPCAPAGRRRAPASCEGEPARPHHGP